MTKETSLPPALPLKESARLRVLDIARELKPHCGEIAADWRARMFEEFELEGRAMAALERLTLGAGFTLFCQNDFTVFYENVRYYGTRLAKLKVDTRIVARALELYQFACEPFLVQAFATALPESEAALEVFASATFMAVSSSYYDANDQETKALLAVLDAELRSQSLAGMLQNTLEITTRSFGATIGIILLLDDKKELRPAAWSGLDVPLDQEKGIPLGRGFTGRIALTGEPDILADTDRSAGLLNPIVRPRAKALWGVPLKSGEDVIGVLTVGFARPYYWLPSELELMRAIADRSAMAIERARIAEALRERETRIAELSAHLLRVQEEERKRISRELHDETGQALMVIRLYLGMLENGSPARLKSKIRETLAVTDRTVEGLRRMIARLSPLVLQELGLVAAIRKEAKELAKSAGVRARVSISDAVGRLAPETETAIYRVVQEALHNVAKHAQAKNVSVQAVRQNGAVLLTIEDDGIGIHKRTPGRTSFGLAGMKERVGMLGGEVHVSAGEHGGTRVEVKVPATASTEGNPEKTLGGNAKVIAAGHAESA